MSSPFHETYLAASIVTLKDFKKQFIHAFGNFVILMYFPKLQFFNPLQ